MSVRARQLASNSYIRGARWKSPDRLEEARVDVKVIVAGIDDEGQKVYQARSVRAELKINQKSELDILTPHILGKDANE
jgi:hypothetical protein